MTEIFIYNVIDNGSTYLEVDCRMNGRATTLIAYRNHGLDVFSSGPREVELDDAFITKVTKP